MAFLLPPNALPVLQSALAQLQSTPAGLIANGLALVVLGLTLLRFLSGVIGFVWAYFLRPGRNLKYYGSWAVLTGATDGIGKAYAVELAKRGLNLVLISRTESKLRDVAAELGAQHGVQTRVVAADLTQPDGDTMARIAAALQGLEVGLLVNNAGLSYDHPEHLHAMEAATVQDIIAINTTALTLLARLVLGGMEERGRGVVINIGSGGATIIPSAPLLSVYAATKAYVDCLSKALSVEYAGAGVVVQNQAPMFVATKMSKIKTARLDAPSAATWAAAAVRQIGREDSFTPYWFHGLQEALIVRAPRWLIDRQVLSLQQGLRARFYRNQARKQAEQAAAAVADAGQGEGEEAAAADGQRELRRRK